MLSHNPVCTLNQYHKIYLILHRTIHCKRIRKFHIIESCHFAKIYSTERVYQFTLIYAIFGLFIENDSKFEILNNCQSNEIQILTLIISLIQCCNNPVNT